MHAHENTLHCLPLASKSLSTLSPLSEVTRQNLEHVFRGCRTLSSSSLILPEDRAEALVPFFQNRKEVTRLFCDPTQNDIWIELVPCFQKRRKVIRAFPDLPQDASQTELEEMNKVFHMWNKGLHSFRPGGHIWGFKPESVWPHRYLSLRDLCTRVAARRGVPTNALPLEMEELVLEERGRTNPV